MYVNKVYPYIVNKSFSCEIYLKIIILYNKSTFTLKQIDRREYIKTLGLESLNNSSNWFSETIISYINYRNLEMRSINRFIKMMSMYENYIYLSYSRRDRICKLLEYIFLPYYLGEQIFNTNNHNNYIRGLGFYEFYNYISNSNKLLSIIDDCLYEGLKEEQIHYEEDLKKIYDLIYNNKNNIYSVKVGTEHFDMSNVKYFHDLSTMLNDYNFVITDE